MSTPPASPGIWPAPGPGRGPGSVWPCTTARARGARARGLQTAEGSHRGPRTAPDPRRESRPALGTAGRGRRARRQTVTSCPPAGRNRAPIAGLFVGAVTGGFSSIPCGLRGADHSSTRWLAPPRRLRETHTTSESPRSLPVSRQGLRDSPALWPPSSKSGPRQAIGAAARPARAARRREGCRVFRAGGWS
jgi:hypothetical protein